MSRIEQAAINAAYRAMGIFDFCCAANRPMVVPRVGRESRRSGAMQEFLDNIARTWRRWTWMERVAVVALIVVLYIVLPSAIFVLR